MAIPKNALFWIPSHFAKSLRILIAFAALASFSRSSVEALTPRTVCDQAALAEAVRLGGIVTFDCDATILFPSVLTVTNQVVIDGAGRSVTLTGDGKTRLFIVTASGSLTLKNVTVANGYASSVSAMLSRSPMFLPAPSSSGS